MKQGIFISAPGHQSAHIDWTKNPKIAEANERRKLQEQAVFVVKVVLPEFGDDGEATVYRQGRKALRHQMLTEQEMVHLSGKRVSFCEATWSNEEVRWMIVGPADAENW